MSSAHGRAQSAACSEATTVLTRAIEVQDIPLAEWIAIGDSPSVAFTDRSGLQIGGWSAAATIEVSASGRFRAVKQASNRLFSEIDHQGPAATRPRLIGGFAFQEDTTLTGRWSAFPEGYFVLPAWMIVKQDHQTWLVHTTVAEDPDIDAHDQRLQKQAQRLQETGSSAVEELPNIEQTELTPDRATWSDVIRSTTAEIADGSLQKVVLATRLTAKLDRPLNTASIITAFERVYPESYRFLIEPHQGQAFFGPSPERLLKVNGKTLTTEALAGSAPRGDDTTTDAQYARRLRESDKIQHEQQLVVDYLLNVLNDIGTATADTQQIKRLATIQHLHTPIQAKLAEPDHVLDCLRAVHPTPAVGGLPKDRAISAIQRYEPFDRGWYAGPVGWFDAQGDGEFAVGIRSGLINDDRLTLYAGNGIVADSDPDTEWEEIKPKYQSILSLLE